MKLGSTAKSLLSFSGLVAVYFVIVLVDRATTVPRTIGQSFEGFLQSKRTPRKIEIIEMANQKFVFVTGAWTPLYLVTIPSGPPCYVFDSSGRLVDWTGDVGDDSRFVKKWPFALKREGIGVERARELFQSKLAVRAAREASP
jgi:hypothetical protein